MGRTFTACLSPRDRSFDHPSPVAAHRGEKVDAIPRNRQGADLSARGVVVPRVASNTIGEPPTMATKQDLVPDALLADLPDRLTVKDLADRGIRSRSTTNRDIAAGRLPAYRIGGRIFILKADVLALVRPVRSA